MQPKTLREYYEQGNSLLVVCTGGGRVYLAPEDPLRCRHTALLELPNIIQHFGWDFDFDKGRYELREALVCSQCGRPFPYIFMHLNGRPLRPAEDEEHVPGLMQHAGRAHAGSDLMPFEEALQRSLELRAFDRVANAEYYEAKAKRGKPGRVRKFGRRR